MGFIAVAPFKVVLFFYFGYVPKFLIRCVKRLYKRAVVKYL